MISPSATEFGWLQRTHAETDGRLVSDLSGLKRLRAPCRVHADRQARECGSDAHLWPDLARLENTARQLAYPPGTQVLVTLPLLTDHRDSQLTLNFLFSQFCLPAPSLSPCRRTLT